MATCSGTIRTGESDGFGQHVTRPCHRTATHRVTLVVGTREGEPVTGGSVRMMCRYHAAAVRRQFSGVSTVQVEMERVGGVEPLAGIHDAIIRLNKGRYVLRTKWGTGSGATPKSVYDQVVDLRRLRGLAMEVEAKLTQRIADLSDDVNAGK